MALVKTCDATSHISLSASLLHTNLGLATLTCGFSRLQRSTGMIGSMIDAAIHLAA